jgi:hypothetical protein
MRARISSFESGSGALAPPRLVPLAVAQESWLRHKSAIEQVEIRRMKIRSFRRMNPEV